MACDIVALILGCESANDKDISITLKSWSDVFQYSPISALAVIHLFNYLSVHIIQAIVSHSSSYTTLHCSVPAYVLLLQIHDLHSIVIWGLICIIKCDSSGHNFTESVYTQ